MAATSSRPVIITIGTSEASGRSRMLRHTWKPLSPGMSTSSSTRSGRSRSNNSSACCPSDARTTRKLALPSVLDANSRNVGSSSAIRTRGSGSILIGRRFRFGQNLPHAVINARVLVLELHEQARAGIGNVAAQRLRLDLPAELGQRTRAHVCAARLEGVCRDAQELRIGLVECAPKLIAAQQRIVSEYPRELGDECFAS